ncbi:MAG TPA: glycosyltransferase [Xanthobacteraceae bacterium]|nr:glycosyltransferase [Xanthobacteraceae bacterium]
MQRASGHRHRRIVIISDFCDGATFRDQPPAAEFAASWLSGERGPRPGEALHSGASGMPEVVGGYLERLPLAAIRQNLCDYAEIWSFWARDEPPPWSQDSPHLLHRSFRADTAATPFASSDMLGHIVAFGPPDILCVWGLGVDEAILEACAGSIKIYNSIDAPALRIPPEVSRHFDLVLTSAQWQSCEVERRHPAMATAIMPIGPEFASPETFFPLGLEKTHDVVYVAAAQPYKRHDVLFQALARLPRSIRALCVCGYGEGGGLLREQAAELGLSIDFIGPPGVSHAEVNRLMNLARVGVVCGVDDGAPAILTEYMLAGLPVLANAALRCGLHYITPLTGRIAKADDFHMVLQDMLADLTPYAPRKIVMENWSWDRTVQKLAAVLSESAPKATVRPGARRGGVPPQTVSSRPAR